MNRALLAVSLALLVVLWAAKRRLLGRVSVPAPTELPPALSRWHLAYLCLVIAGASALRAWLSNEWAPENGEYGALARGCDFAWSSFERTDEFHAPLHPISMWLWLRLDDWLGVDYGLFALRVPNLVLGALALWLTARLGALLRVPLAGLAAATLLAFTPFALKLFVTQQNYLLELTASLFFAERLLQYLLWRRPVYRSLALATALAMWSGYMNLPIVGIGALLMSVAALRRRQWREAAYTLALLVLLLLPLAPLAFSAGKAYFALSANEDASQTDLASRELALRHPVMQVGVTFSEGTVGGGVMGMVAGLFGPMTYVFFAGALLLLVLRRLQALPLLLLLVSFPVLGTVVYLKPQNYAALVPFVFFAFAWGFAELAKLVARPLRSRAALAATLSLVLVAAATGAGLYGAHSYLPDRTIRVDRRFEFFASVDTEVLRRALASVPPETPVILYDVYTDKMHPALFYSYVCEAPEPACRRVECAHRGGAEAATLGGWLVTSMGRREVAVPRWQRQPGSRPQPLIPDVPALFARPSFAEHGALVIRTKLPPQLPETAALRRYLATRCPVLAEDALLSVARCSPLGAVSKELR